MCHRTCVINKVLVVGQVRVARWVARAVHQLFHQPLVVDAVDLAVVTRRVPAAVAAAERILCAAEHTSIVARSVEGRPLESSYSYSQHYRKSWSGSVSRCELKKG